MTDAENNTNNRKWYGQRYFWAGILARALCAPFLLQWFHPDERQMLEFAHFHAHGRLHPFMESVLHLRNQALPWLFSQILNLCDLFGAGTPWVYLTAIHLCIGVISWVCLTMLVESYRGPDPRSQRATTVLGWFFALFWAFPFLYSRQLLEAVSLPSTLLLLLALRRRKIPQAGFWAGITCGLRYPSALFAAGAGLVLMFMAKSSKPTFSLTLKTALTSVIKFTLGFVPAIAIIGLPDLLTYGRWMNSAWAYWSFNRPHGPVEQMFGNDNLIVYWRWFAFIFTPWLAPLFIGLGVYALIRSPFLCLFTLPYIAGHLWTSHREPRFMLPLTPILALAIGEAWISEKLTIPAKLVNLTKLVNPAQSSDPATLSDSAQLGPAIMRGIIVALLALHILLNFTWYPLNLWGQWKSSQGTLIRHWTELAARPGYLANFGDPVIDALVPPTLRWADSRCRWHRPELIQPSNPPLWVIAENKPQNRCEKSHETIPDLRSSALHRLLRIRPADLWNCPYSRENLRKLCPQGLTEEPPGEPYFSQHHL